MDISGNPVLTKEADLSVRSTEKNRPLRVGIVDKSSLVVRGLKSLFEDDRRFELVASASDGARLLDGLDMLTLDIVISGWIMPYCDGRHLLEALKLKRNPPKVVIYTGVDNEQVAREAMELGAVGFYSKSDKPEHLLAVLDTVARGSMVFPFMKLKAEDLDPLSSLTPRERAMLELLSTGLTNKELADSLDVSPNTVKFHLRNIYTKLHVRNRTEAISLYLSQYMNRQNV